MKIFLYLVVVISGFLASSLIYATGSSIQQQGFESFAEKDGKINFSCKIQCVYILGPYSHQYDYITTEIVANGKGGVGYGFVNGQQIIPGEVVPLKNGEEKFVFSKLAFLSQLPDGMPLVMIVDGAISGKMSAKFGMNTLGESISKNWSQFWTPEKYGYYSINLLYGPKIFDSSFAYIWGWIFIVVVLFIVFILIFKGDSGKIKKTYAWISIIFFLLFGLRFGLDQYILISEDISNYVYGKSETQSFRNYNDIDAFARFALGHLFAGSKARYLGYQDWPYTAFLPYNLWPKIQIDEKAKYVIVYGNGNFVIQNNSLLDLSKEGKVIFEKVKLIASFKDTGFILELP